MLRIFCSCFINSWNQIAVLHARCIPMFVMVLSATVRNVGALLYVCVIDVAVLCKIGTIFHEDGWVKGEILRTVNIALYVLNNGVLNCRKVKPNREAVCSSKPLLLAFQGYTASYKRHGNMKEGCDFVNENCHLTGFDFRMRNGDNYVKDALLCTPIAHCSRQIEAERERSTRDTGSAVQTDCTLVHPVGLHVAVQGPRCCRRGDDVTAFWTAAFVFRCISVFLYFSLCLPSFISSFQLPLSHLHSLFAFYPLKD